jgi:hypothetical protein
MRSNSGEVVTGLLIGLAVGAAMLFVGTGKQAQRLADTEGRAVSQWEVIMQQPGKSALTLGGPAAAGAGLGYLVESLDNSKSSDGNVTVSVPDNRGNVSVSIIGDQDNDTISTSTPNNNNSFNTPAP